MEINMEISKKSYNMKSKKMEKINRKTSIKNSTSPEVEEKQKSEMIPNLISGDKDRNEGNHEDDD